MYDVLIVGGGPIGLHCAIEAQKKGLACLVIEKGCFVNSLYNYPSNMSFFSTSEKLEIGDIPFYSLNPRPTRNEALEYYRRVKMYYNISLKLFERVTRMSATDWGFEVGTNKQCYRTKRVIIASGFYDEVNRLDVAGENLPKVQHYYSDPHFYCFQKVVIVGARSSAVNAALELYRKGAEVTMVIREDSIHPDVKYWIRPDIVNRIAEGGIKAIYRARVVAIRSTAVDISVNNALQTIDNDFVLALTGYKPSFELLEKAGIQFSQDGLQKPLYNPDTMETNVSGIYLAGVVCGGMDTHSWFIENSRIHATLIVDSIVAQSSVVYPERH